MRPVYSPAPTRINKIIGGCPPYSPWCPRNPGIAPGIGITDLRRPNFHSYFAANTWPWLGLRPEQFWYPTPVFSSFHAQKRQSQRHPRGEPWRTDLRRPNFRSYFTANTWPWLGLRPEQFWYPTPLFRLAKHPESPRSCLCRGYQHH